MNTALFKKSYLPTLILAVCIAILPSTQAFAQKTYLLEYKPKKGTKGEMIMKMDMNINMEVMGQEMTTSTNMEIGADMEVSKSTGTETTTSMKYNFMAMRMEAPIIGEILYDSRTDDTSGMIGQSMNKAFNQIKDEENTIVQDRTGKTISMEMSDGFEQMQSGQNNGGFGMAMSMSAFPSHPIAIGETWKQTLDDTASFMKIITTYTLKSVKGGKVTLDFESAVEKNEAFTGQETANTVSGTQHGTLVYREKDMWLLNSEINQDLKMTVAQMEMEIPMDLKSTTILSVD